MIVMMASTHRVARYCGRLDWLQIAVKSAPDRVTVGAERASPLRVSGAFWNAAQCDGIRNVKRSRTSQMVRMRNTRMNSDLSLI